VEPVYKSVTNHEKLTAVYGRWPSFHDTEVVSIRMDRDAGAPFTGVQLTVTFHVFRIEVAPDDPARDNRLVTLVFRAAEQLSLRDFNHQNAIIDFVLSLGRSERLNADIFYIHLKQGFGVDLSFECRAIEVLSVEPFTPQWGAWARGSPG
jgi:hypothetical protein